MAGNAFANNMGLPAEVLLAVAGQGGGGGGGEPSAYIKSAEVSDDGLTLTLTKKNGTTVTFSVSDLNTAVDALGTAVDGKQDTILDLSDIRTGAGKGATSVQTVNGEEPDDNGNVNVSASEGQYIEADAHTALANWGDCVYDELYEAISFLDLYILGTNPNDNKVIRCVIDVETDITAESPISISGDVEYTIMWANGTAPTFTADHTYEVVISKAPNNRLLCSWSEFGD